MKRIGRISILAILALLIATWSIPQDAFSGKNREGRGGHRTRANHKAIKHRQVNHRSSLTRHRSAKERHRSNRKHQFKNRHRAKEGRYHHDIGHHSPYWHRYWYAHRRYPSHYTFGYFLYPGYRYRAYYPYRTQESVLVYKEPAGQYGFLKLDILPEETEVFLNGKYLGRAAEIRDIARTVPVGSQQLQLRLGGYSSDHSIYISPNSTSHFFKDLSTDQPNERYLEDPRGVSQGIYACSPERDEGVLRVRVQPEDADIIVNNTSLGKAANLAEAGIVLPEGTHQLRMEAAGHKPYETAIQVTCGTPSVLNVMMLKSG